MHLSIYVAEIGYTPDGHPYGDTTRIAAQIVSGIGFLGAGAILHAHGAVVGQGGTSTVTAKLKPGTYTFYCSVDGHEAAGMKGTLTVK